MLIFLIIQLATLRIRVSKSCLCWCLQLSQKHGHSDAAAAKCARRRGGRPVALFQQRGHSAGAAAKCARRRGARPVELFQQHGVLTRARFIVCSLEGQPLQRGLIMSKNEVLLCGAAPTHSRAAPRLDGKPKLAFSGCD